MKYLMLMWVNTDAASGDESDMAAWVEFEQQAKDAEVLVVGSALQPSAQKSMLVKPELAKPDPGEEMVLGTFSNSNEQIEAFYILECADDAEAAAWARRLPTWGTVEVRPFLEYDLSS